MLELSNNYLRYCI